MKRTPLKRKTQLKSKTPFKSGSTILRKTPLKAVSFKKQGSSSTMIYSTFKNKGNGLKGHGRTNDDIQFHNRVASLGCLACRILKVKQHFPTRIHHSDGRSKGKENDYSERRVIPLCDQHHHPSLAFEYKGETPNIDLPSVHDRKKLFVELVGSEESLVDMVYELLEETPAWIQQVSVCP